MDYASRREKEHQMHKSDIIDTAESLFCEKGYINTSMDEIARKSGFTKRTIYQYFPNKQDLYFAVACKKYQTILDAFEVIKNKQISGFKKMHDFLFTYYKFYNDDPHTFLMLKYCPSLRDNEKGSPFYKQLDDITAQFFDIIIATIEAGKKDKSIRANLDSVMGAHSLVHLTIGFFYRLVELEHEPKALQINGKNQKDYIDFSLGLLLNILKPNTSIVI